MMNTIFSYMFLVRRSANELELKPEHKTKVLLIGTMDLNSQNITK